jgi:hypothetical protein
MVYIQEREDLRACHITRELLPRQQDLGPGLCLPDVSCCCAVIRIPSPALGKREASTSDDIGNLLRIQIRSPGGSRGRVSQELVLVPQ